MLEVVDSGGPEDGRTTLVRLRDGQIDPDTHIACALRAWYSEYDNGQLVAFALRARPRSMVTPLVAHDPQAAQPIASFVYGVSA